MYNEKKTTPEQAEFAMVEFLRHLKNLYHESPFSIEPMEFIRDSLPHYAKGYYEMLEGEDECQDG